MGDEAKKLGLIDEIGDVEAVIKYKFAKSEIVNFSKQSKYEEFMERVGGSAQLYLKNQLISKFLTTKQ